MKHTFARLALAGAMGITGTMAIASPAAADTPGCVTRSEFETVYRHETVASVNDHFDTGGLVVDDLWWRNGHDLVRSYRKCVGFDGGRGRVGVAFDDYSHSGAGYNDHKMRLFGKAPMNPYRLVWWW